MGNFGMGHSNMGNFGMGHSRMGNFGMGHSYVNAFNLPCTLQVNVTAAELVISTVETIGVISTVRGTNE